MSDNEWKNETSGWQSSTDPLTGAMRFEARVNREHATAMSAQRMHTLRSAADVIGYVMQGENEEREMWIPIVVGSPVLMENIGLYEHEWAAMLAIADACRKSIAGEQA